MQSKWEFTIGNGWEEAGDLRLICTGEGKAIGREGEIQITLYNHTHTDKSGKNEGVEKSNPSTDLSTDCGK